ncbi:NAD(P)/FAD-dependent oxidoreductase [Streptomyces sp. NEAU-Y11]|uniref:NAD(P)/FAD-dependent oxidoreductase n=1 Tax=Streptomyces cucumeris TaxID=2962890 RepID=UPI0020C8D842|nr:FAD-binding oxidoreductase [Streptomyces sp. NEAU-Y11]MCP9207852.1 FAD-binding oxidoreductase [Streptomyces sp. NEAU-Y11]
MLNGNVSFWYRQTGFPERRPPLDGDLTTDVCVVGAGFTGLWTAYYLKRAAPELDITVVEREFAGFGASGRNAGWLSSKIAGSAATYARRRGRDAVIALQREMVRTVDEVIAVAETEGIGADIVRSGYLTVAHGAAQLPRLRTVYEQAGHWGMPDLRWLSAPEVTMRLRLDGALAGYHNPHCARVHPAKLVRGLAEAVAARGVRILESTPVTAIAPGRVSTPFGTVRADRIVRATEGFTSALEGERRTWLPMNSSMIVTEPLPDRLWKRLGWEGQELLSDATHAYTYGQRTPDGRIAIGGRGVPYRFGSRTDRSGQTSADTVRALRSILTSLFPDTADTAIDHTWSGVLAVPRDWCASIDFDPATGLGSAGGYVGHGVAATNLAGRTLCDLLLGRSTELTALPWVGHRTRKWEPEPLRWLGVHGMYAAYRAADRIEAAGRTTTSPIALLADRISGR